MGGSEFDVEEGAAGGSFQQAPTPEAVGLSPSDLSQHCTQDTTASCQTLPSSS